MIATPITAAIGGLIVGSFVTTAALRATRGEQALRGRSACDGCGVQLSYAASVPIVSYLRRRGTCSDCGGRIDPFHPLGEAASGLGAALAFSWLAPLDAVLACLLGLSLLATSIIDARTRRLPDALTLTVAVLALGLAGLRGVDAVIAGLIAAVIAFALLATLRMLSARGGKEPSLGFGDVKLVSALALWLGAQTPWAVAIAALAGLLVMAVRRPQDRKISFGPALAFGGWVIGVTVQAGLWLA